MIRGINLRGAIALNVITMIGIGPLITIPLVLAQLAGPLALAGWVAGALVALCDGLVWAELGSRYPGAGGTYAYLRDVFGANGWGRLLAFLYNWQYFLSSGLVIATGYIGFAQYAGYLYAPAAANPNVMHLIAVGIGLVSIAFVYRRITAVARLGTYLGLAAIVTLVIVGIAGFAHGDVHRAFTLPATGSLGWGFVAGLGSALFVTLYDYAGYAQIALVGEEVERPQRTLPLAIIAAIFIVLALYLFLQIGVLSGMPWQSLLDRAGNPTAQSQYVAATVVQHAWGTRAAVIVTALILVTAFASLYGNLVGAARVPFAAARDGAFLPVFARLHPTKQFPHVALLGIGAISLAACFLNLADVIALLSAAGILTGNIAQIGALFALRMRGERTPFRMWLYPLPAIVALAGWCYAFASTGPRPIALGMAWLAAGVIVYLFIARRQRAWPFAARAVAGVFAMMLFCNAAPARAQHQSFFLYGATFFYERVPRDQWADALRRYRAMGINTIDLYVMWNWHEISDGAFDFTGRTNPRRDLLGLLKLIDADGFKIVLRPGPVIRNEWRNGGYPAWLLERPQYDMPLRDVLEGRYPATATLQNAHSDAAAREWMNNPVHMRYATRWLQTVLHAVAPWQRDLVAISLDDDQGAYIDNDTWPGPHFHQYIHYLASVVRKSAPGIPTFINTYEMKVTASAPAWAWGNWYQSDAYSIGEHDRTQLEFSTGLLQTQRRPIMISEFQAGWLQDADQPAPRPADPTNTTLALHTLLQMGAHGIVNFPAQDTLNPAGWEAPWTNAFYSWDAALSVQLTPQARWKPTAAFGSLVARYGAQLAHTHRAADAAVSYLTSAYDPPNISNEDIAHIAQVTMDAQRGCRIMRISCSIVDLRYVPLSDLRRYAVLIVPPDGLHASFIPSVRQKLAAYRASGGRIVSSARRAHVASPVAGGVPNAALLVSDDRRFAFLDIVNYGRTQLHVRAARVHEGSFSAQVPAQTVPARDAVLVPLGAVAPREMPLAVVRGPSTKPSPEISKGQDDKAGQDDKTTIPLRAGSVVSVHAPLRDGVYARDVYRDGYPAIVMQNRAVRLIVSPCAGARAFVFEDFATHENFFTTVGGLRDSWKNPLPPSARDYIGKYTHPIATGTFNRCYSVRVSGAARETSFSYTAPDAPPAGARFRKKIALDPDGFTETLNAAFTHSPTQRAQTLTSFAIDRGTNILRVPNGIGFYARSKQRLVAVVWQSGSVSGVDIQRHTADALVTLTFSAGPARRLRYRVVPAHSAANAQAQLRVLSNRP
ncbi:MAG TPA: amino acid permease [Candidatus Baltobacteraceae bacterium]|nr:amino acid permease [Candidatus Baltobacteraceae bacterium]